MAQQQQFNGATQIKPGTITTTQLSGSAGITDAQLAGVYVYANGARAFTGAVNVGSNQINNVATPTSGTDATNKAYVDAAVAGLSGKLAAVAATNSETLTITSGNVTSIAGTTADGKSPNVGDYVLVANAPATSGAAGGAVLSNQPANGLYQVTGNTTNLTLQRALDMAGSVNPMGATVVVVGGPTWGGAELMVTTPSSSAAFTYGTGTIAFTQVSGAGEITVTNVLSKTGNQLAVSAMATGTVILGNGGTPTITALSGAITVGATGTTTLGAGVVALSNLASLAANSLIGNSTGSSATPTAVPMSQAASASSVPIRDANQNLYANAFIDGGTSTATSGGTTTLVASSSPFQQFTGTQIQTAVLPAATGLPLWMPYFITNRSTGVVTVNANGGTLIQAMAAGSQLLLTLTNNGSAAGTWDATYITTSGVTSFSSSNGFSGSVSLGVATLSTSVASGLLASNGSGGIQAATGSNIAAHQSINENPSGTVNGANTTFTLANTPIAGTLVLYQNGQRLRYGSGYDYTLSGTTITMNFPPQSSPSPADYLQADYWY
jgi:hypothetical protein